MFSTLYNYPSVQWQIQCIYFYNILIFNAWLKLEKCSIFLKTEQFLAAITLDSSSEHITLKYRPDNLLNTYPLFARNSTFPKHQVKSTIRILDWASNKALKQRKQNKML
jgi:hypothetical protein